MNFKKNTYSNNIDSFVEPLRSQRFKKFCLLISILFFLANCSKPNVYEKTINDYFKYLKNEDYKNAYLLLSDKDRLFMSMEDFSKNDESYLASKVNKETVYKIKDFQVSESQSSVAFNVEVGKINLAKLYYFIPQLEDKNLTKNQIDGYFFNNSTLIKKCFMKENVKYNLIKENNSWKINAGFGQQKRVKELFDIADKYLNKNQYEDALRTYKNILDFQSDNARALNKIEAIEEKKNFIKKFLKATIISWEKKNNDLIINLNLENNGTIAVKQVYARFSVYFNDKILLDENEKLLNNSGLLGFNESKRLEMVFHKFNNNFNKINCDITAIDY